MTKHQEFQEDARRVATHAPTGFTFDAKNTAFTQIATDMIAKNSVGGSQTTGGIRVKEQEKQKNGSRTARIMTSMSQNININLNFGYFDPELKGTKLNSKNVTVSKEGALQINGKTATTDNLVQLQNQSNQSSMYRVTPDMIEMNNYVRGQTDVIPPSLMKAAKAAGIENPTREDIEGVIKDKYDTDLTQNIYRDITSENPLKLEPLQISPTTTQDLITGKEELPKKNMSYMLGSKELVGKNMSYMPGKEPAGQMARIQGYLIPGQPDSTDDRTATSAAPAGFKPTPLNVNGPFNRTANAPMSSQPLVSPEQTLNFTPAPVQVISLGGAG